MANLLNVAMIESIQALHAQQWSARRIARELGVDRETVGKYLRRGSCDSKPANLPTGSAGSKPATLTELPAGGSKPARARRPGRVAGMVQPVSARRTTTRSWPSTRRGCRRVAFSRTWATKESRSTTTRCGVISVALGGARHCRFAGCSASPAKKRRWTLAPAHRSSLSTVGDARRTCFGSCSVTRARVIAKPRSRRRPTTSCARLRMRSGTSAVCRGPW